MRGLERHEQDPVRVPLRTYRARADHPHPSPGAVQRRRLVPAGDYLGGVYAVPHPPRCTPTYPCTGRTSEYECEHETPCRPIDGVLPFQYYSYPGGLPKPIDATARIIGTYSVRFQSPAKSE